MKQNTTKRNDFEARAMPHLDSLYRTALYMTGNESYGQDLVQESLIRAYLAWHECPSNSNCRAWLFKIMANVLISRYRPSPSLSAAITKTERVDIYSLYSGSVNQRPVNDPRHIPFLARSENQVKKVIGDLPDDCRLIVVLSLLEGFSYREIADIAGITLDIVRSRLHQGRKLMQREFYDHAVCEGKYDMPAGKVRSRNAG